MTYKEKAELIALRRRVETQREEIRQLQAERIVPASGDALTLGALWKATTQDIYLRRYGQTPLKLPSGGRLQLEHRDLIVRKIEIVTRACEAPCFLVETEPGR